VAPDVNHLQTQPVNCYFSWCQTLHQNQCLPSLL